MSVEVVEGGLKQQSDNGKIRCSRGGWDLVVVVVVVIVGDGMSMSP